MKKILLLVGTIVVVAFAAGCGGGGGSSDGQFQSPIEAWRTAERACDTLPLKEAGAPVKPAEVLRVLRTYGTLPYGTETGPEHLETACEAAARGWSDCEGQSAYGYRALREYSKWSDWDIWLVQVKVTRNGQSWRHVFLRVGGYAFDPNNAGPWQVWDYEYFIHHDVIVEEVYNQWG